MLPRGLLLVFVVMPVGYAFTYAILYSLGAIGLLSHGWTAEHWQTALTNGRAAASLVWSLAIAAVVTVLTTAFATAIVMLYRDALRRPMVIAVLCLIMGTPAIVIGLLVSQWLSGGGMIARVAYHLGLLISPTDFPSLVNDRFGIGLIVALTISYLPLMLLTLAPIWDHLGGERLCQTAEALGAGRWEARWKVGLPMLLMRGRPIVLLIFLFAMGSYEIPLLVGRQSPQMFSVATQRQAGLYDLSERPQAFVLATLYFVACAVLLVIFVRGRRAHA